MFFFLATVSMLGYALQTTLLTKFARKMDGLSLAVYRNSSFILSLSPLLFFAGREEIVKVVEFWPEILAMAITGVIRLVGIFIAVKYLPLGLANSLGRITLILSLILWGFLFFGEVLSPLQLLLILVVLAGGLLMFLVKNDMPHIDNNFLKGSILVVIPGIIGSFSFFFMAKVSRELNPFVSGYFWEFSIAIFAMLLVWLRKIFFGKGLHKVSGKEYMKIASASFPTFIGTGALSLAVTMGPLGIAGAVNSASVIIVAVLAHYLYGEKLKKAQWLGILIVVVGLVGLKVLEGS